MTALDLFCEIVAVGGNPVASDYRERPGYAALLCHGFLQEVGVVSSIVCDECDAPHSAQVVYEDEGYGYHCPGLGFVELDEARIIALKADAERLVGTLGKALGCKRRKETPIHGQTWRVGALEAEAGAVLVYFHAKLQSEADARSLLDALNREVRAQWRLVVTVAGAMPVAGAQTVRLDDLAEIDTETGALRIVTVPADLVGMPRKTLSGRPSAHGDVLKPLIERRIQTGEAFEAVSAEFREVRDLFLANYPHRPLPSESTIKRYIREARVGS